MSSGLWRRPATFLILSLALFTFSLPVPVHASTPLPTVGVWGDAYGSPDISGPSIGPNTTIVVDINVSNAPAFNGYEYTLYFDPVYLQPTYLDVRSGIFTNPFIGVKDLSPGRIHLAVVNLGYAATSGSGVLTRISFNVTGRGVSPLTLAAATTEPSTQSYIWTQLVLLTQEIPVTTADGHFSNVLGDPGPVANFTFTPSLPLEGQTVTFNASGSYDPDNNSTDRIRQYQWDFGDGETVNVTSPIVTHTYQSGQYPFPTYAGNFSARLTVIDADNGFEGMVTHLVSVSPPPPICHAGLVTAKVPDECPSVQMAVNSIINGGTVLVSRGIYWENVVVQKPLRIIGSGANQTTIFGSIEIDQSPNVTVTGFRIITGFYSAFGLKLFDSPHANITDNVFTGSSSKEFANSNGILLENSENVSLTRNVVRNVTFGLSIDSSPNSVLRTNILSGNSFNFMVSGSYYENIDESNTVDGKPIFYGTVTNTAQIPTNPGFLGIIGSHDVTLEKPSIANEGQGILVFNSTRIRIDSFDATNDSIGVNIVNSTSVIVTNGSFGGGASCTGVKLEFTSHSILENNTIHCSVHGVDLEYSSASSIAESTLESGVFLGFSTNNTLAENNMTGQTIISSSSNNSMVRNTFTGSLELASSTGNLFSNNQFYGEKPGLFSGIEIFNSPKNVLRENSITNMFFQVSSYHFDCPLVTIPCQYLTDYVQDIGPSNTLGGRPMFYLVNRSNVRVPSNANFVGVVNSTNIIVQNASPEYSEEILAVSSRNVQILNSNLTMPIFAWADQNLTITDNTMRVDDGGSAIIDVRGSSRGIISGNSIVGLSIRGFPADAGIALVNSATYTIEGNFVTGLYFTGIDLRGSTNNTIYRNTVAGNQNSYGETTGIRLTTFGFGSLFSTGNLLVGNTIAENYVGLLVDTDNTIYENNFIQNVFQVESDPGNTWDNGAGRGNYWSDYTGQDTNSDGVGDTLLPYLGVDNYPLMSPWIPSNLNASLVARGSWPEFRRLSLGKASASQTLYARVSNTGTGPEWVRVEFNVTSPTGSQQVLSGEIWTSPGTQSTVSISFPVVAGSYKVVATAVYSSDGYQEWSIGNSKTFAFQTVP